MDFSRNWLFIDQETQRKLSDKRLLIVGSGIGSFISELAVRTGFQHLIIADGDDVSHSNLNRQNYRLEDVGAPKVHSLEARLLAINPNLNLTVIPKYMGATELREFIPQADYIINTIDFDSPDFLLCSQLCREHHKIELFPMNLGFGASLCIFSQTCPTWRDLFQFEDHIDLKASILQYLAATQSVESYLYQALGRYQSEYFHHGCDPQLGISTYMVSAMTVANLVKLVKGDDIRYFPEFYYLDPYGNKTISAA
ncbi:HesA/MoeB/ThiF family protein [Pseudobacteriovorax antillogorgiicola]|uniref:ThiF family protein n=1 Tax=Pseudobacteriovorax antillogorgiicola TaxID=1513793 RepID=A0A1Y6BLF8_9BACT|nr:ThiF family adenylyltransferase [Pseudobacteriovorax antillogorgiicola]TCS55344.1 ThiF family protein [Pseudobacteriovorax antillogorgiicola]SMF13827.1 ThiF family protein [Pseudobacteriovorax antillogorgiicola]